MNLAKKKMQKYGCYHNDFTYFWMNELPLLRKNYPEIKREIRHIRLIAWKIQLTMFLKGSLFLILTFIIGAMIEIYT
ncbi:hypothetical protein PVA45_01705 [Entomospira entomophila]|uniref:Uncharacterized protein n=1 Tax=Entomospira entomophila TaxID=2719988 RepID=A0A968KR00_9SPIO|nr:hypothetical protein [Entomospira entomophilus]NIZ40228.1 hypothetical protein [Entomospira entomophilus]WDI35787.1 hypothetical protein PVA45_01705 [Entomospira entomophilus]